MGGKKKKPNSSLENINPEDLNGVKHVQLIPIEASETISEFVKEFREIFMPKFKQMEKETKSLKLQLHNALEKIEFLENEKKSTNLIIKNLPQKDDIEKSTLNFLSKKMKMSANILKNKVEKITKVGPKDEPIVKVHFKHPYRKNVLKKESNEEKITCHSDLNLETRIKRSIMWTIGNNLKAKTKNDFSISRFSELCLIGRDGNKKFLKYK